jgi:hypothetical protein
MEYEQAPRTRGRKKKVDGRRQEKQVKFYLDEVRFQALKEHVRQKQTSVQALYENFTDLVLGGKK